MNKNSYLSLCFGIAGLALGVSGASAQTQLILDGNFATNPAIAAGSYSPSVGRTGTAGAVQVLTGTTGTAGWFTSESDGLFEVWTPGYQGSPTGVGNTMELANSSGGNTMRQDVTTSVGGGASATFSFGYSARDAGGQDKFTLTITDQTKGTTILNQAFNPTAAFTTNTVYSNTFAITVGDAYRVAFLDQNNTGTAGLSSGATSAHIANVSFVQAAVPEPGSAVYIAAGVVGLGLVQRVRRSRLAS